MVHADRPELVGTDDLDTASGVAMAGVTRRIPIWAGQTNFGVDARHRIS